MMEPEKTFTLNKNQVDRLNWQLADVGAMVGCLCVAVMRIKDFGVDFDLEHYVAMVEERFGDLQGEFNEALGQTVKAQENAKKPKDD
jgi:hypothetical protein